MLSDKQQRFVSEYLVTLNASEAARRAGYSEKTAASQGQRLLRNVEIQEAVGVGKAGQLEKAELTAARVLEEIRRLSFSDLRTLFDETGNLRPLHTLTSEQAACIASVEVVKKNLTAGDGQMDTVIKLKVWDKTRSLEMLAKHFALLTERVQHGGEIVMRHEMPE